MNFKRKIKRKTVTKFLETSSSALDPSSKTTQQNTSKNKYKYKFKYQHI